MPKFVFILRFEIAPPQYWRREGVVCLCVRLIFFIPLFSRPQERLQGESDRYWWVISGIRTYFTTERPAVAFPKHLHNLFHWNCVLRNRVTVPWHLPARLQLRDLLSLPASVRRSRWEQGDETWHRRRSDARQSSNSIGSRRLNKWYSRTMMADWSGSETTRKELLWTFIVLVRKSRVCECQSGSSSSAEQGKAGWRVSERCNK